MSSVPCPSCSEAVSEQSGGCSTGLIINPYRYRYLHQPATGLFDYIEPQIKIFARCLIYGSSNQLRKNGCIEQIRPLTFNRLKHGLSIRDKGSPIKSWQLRPI